MSERLSASRTGSTPGDSGRSCCLSGLCPGTAPTGPGLLAVGAAKGCDCRLLVRKRCCWVWGVLQRNATMSWVFCLWLTLRQIQISTGAWRKLKTNSNPNLEQFKYWYISFCQRQGVLTITSRETQGIGRICLPSQSTEEPQDRMNFITCGERLGFLATRKYL